MVIGGVSTEAKSSQRMKWKPFPPRLPVGYNREAKLPAWSWATGQHSGDLGTSWAEWIAFAEQELCE
eukprot:500638-Heterocapsa_arctica.AAC.1